MEKIEIKKVTKEEREVLLLLEKMDKCLYGDFFKKLKLSQINGAATILSLLTKGYIRNVGTTSYYELNGELIK